MITGIRICTHCKGLCHTRAWRTKYKQRKLYWCSESHLAMDRRPPGVSDSAWVDVRSIIYEPVNVLTG